MTESVQDVFEVAMAGVGCGIQLPNEPAKEDIEVAIEHFKTVAGSYSEAIRHLDTYFAVSADYGTRERRILQTLQ